MANPLARCGHVPLFASSARGDRARRAISARSRRVQRAPAARRGGRRRPCCSSPSAGCDVSNRWRATCTRAARRAGAPFIRARLRAATTRPIWIAICSARRPARRPSDLDRWSRRTAGSPPRAAARCSCTTSPSCRRPRRRGSRGLLRDGEVRIDGEPVADRLPPDRERAAGHRRRSCTRIASARICTAALSATRIDLPPLRDRADDVPALAARLLDELCAAPTARRATFTQAALALLGALHVARQSRRAARRRSSGVAAATATT